MLPGPRAGRARRGQLAPSGPAAGAARPAPGVAGSSGGGGRGGSGGSAGTGGSGSGGSGGLPALTVSGNKLQDPTRQDDHPARFALIDIGALYAYSGNSAAGITARMDKIAAAGVQGHAVRLPVYPKIYYNRRRATARPARTRSAPGRPLLHRDDRRSSAADYVTPVLRPAIDYATSKNLYAIIDYHQIDNAITGTSAADATTFWTDIAPSSPGSATSFTNCSTNRSTRRRRGRR